MHWKSFQDPGEYLQPHQFAEPKTVTISRVCAEKDPEGKTSMVIYFSHKGKELKQKMHVAKSVRYSISLYLGSDETEDWHGKDITIYQTKCLSFGVVEPCIRLKVSKEIDDKVRAWLKKRKSSIKCYKLED